MPTDEKCPKCGGGEKEWWVCVCNELCPTLVSVYPKYWARADGVIVSTQRVGFGPYIGPHELSPWADNKGYLHVQLTVNGRKRKFYLHRLILNAYQGPKPTSKHEARHLDGNKENNHADNLVWGTHAENMADA